MWKNGDPDFDDTMVSLDSVELCELVGLYNLHIFGEKCGNNRIGLYCVDGLACFEHTIEPQSDRIRKDFVRIFKGGFELGNL